MGTSRNTKRTARALMHRFDIPYTQALEAVRDARALPEWPERCAAQRRTGKSHLEAAVAVCVDTWEFE